MAYREIRRWVNREVDIKMKLFELIKQKLKELKKRIQNMEIFQDVRIIQIVNIPIKYKNTVKMQYFFI